MCWLSTLRAKACGTSSRLKTAPASCTVSQMALMRWVSEMLLFFLLLLHIRLFSNSAFQQWEHYHSMYQFTKTLIMTYTHSLDVAWKIIRHQPFVAFKKLVKKKKSSGPGSAPHMHSWMVGVEEGGWEVGSSGKKWHWSRKWQEGAVLTFPFPCIYHRFRSQLSTC